MEKTSIEVNGTKYWIDWDMYEKVQRFEEEQERKYWAYHFSGQRTIDMFGVEGAKRILKLQDERDEQERRT